MFISEHLGLDSAAWVSAPNEGDIQTYFESSSAGLLHDFLNIRPVRWMVSTDDKPAGAVLL
jgi:hypothetical protein